MSDKDYRVLKRVNNNTVLATLNQSDEVILMGKGLGFQKYPGDVIYSKQIERVFVLKQSESEKNQTVNLIESLNEEILFASKEVVDVVEAAFNTTLNPLVIFNLADHLEFAIDRHKSGIIMTNPLEQEIQLFYPDEFAMAVHTIKYLNQHFDFNIDEHERSFIAMHFVNSGKNFSNEMNETVVITRLTAEIVSLIEDDLGYSFDYSRLEFSRLTTHLRFFIVRNLRHNHSKTSDLEMTGAIRSKFSKEYDLAIKIANYLQNQLDWHISEDELTYLTIHLARVNHGGQ